MLVNLRFLEESLTGYRNWLGKIENWIHSKNRLEEDKNNDFEREKHGTEYLRSLSCLPPPLFLLNTGRTCTPLRECDKKSEETKTCHDQQKETSGILQFDFQTHSLSNPARFRPSFIAENESGLRAGSPFQISRPTSLREKFVSYCCSQPDFPQTQTHLMR